MAQGPTKRRKQRRRFPSQSTVRRIKRLFSKRQWKKLIPTQRLKKQFKILFNRKRWSKIFNRKNLLGVVRDPAFLNLIATALLIAGVIGALRGSLLTQAASRHVTTSATPSFIQRVTETPTRGASLTFFPSATREATRAATAQSTQSTASQPTFPIRAAFYYPWFPEAWKQKGFYPFTNYNPVLGLYDSSDQAIIKKHIAMMQYGNIQAGIASWWGQGTQTDARTAGLLKAAEGTDFHWALYYEAEGQGNPSAEQIQSDLIYIRDHYANQPNFLQVGGRFVIFAYSSGGENCSMADRWKKGNTVGAYVVLKDFPGHLKCASQPDAWHQYAPATAAFQEETDSYIISPGFWLKGGSNRLKRDVGRWEQNIREMITAGTNWQLITTFNEWGEGTAIEPAEEWSSSSGFGQYLDALHSNGVITTTATP